MLLRGVVPTAKDRVSSGHPGGGTSACDATSSSSSSSASSCSGAVQSPSVASALALLSWFCRPREAWYRVDAGRLRTGSVADDDSDGDGAVAADLVSVLSAHANALPEVVWSTLPVFAVVRDGEWFSVFDNAPG